MPGRVSRSVQWLREQAFFLLVVAGVAAALLYLLVEPGHWSRGTGAIAASVLGGALLRLCLPTSRVGLLAARSRVVDTLVYLLLGGLMLAVDIRLHK